MKFGQCFWTVLALGVFSLPAYAQFPVTVTQQADGVTVKTATDTLRLTVCGPTSIHVVASPDGSATSATPKQPWLIEPCTPAKFRLNVPTERPAPPAQRA